MSQPFLLDRHGRALLVFGPHHPQLVNPLLARLHLARAAKKFQACQFGLAMFLAYVVQEPSVHVFDSPTGMGPPLRHHAQHVVVAALAGDIGFLVLHR